MAKVEQAVNGEDFKAIKRFNAGLFRLWKAVQRACSELALKGKKGWRRLKGSAVPRATLTLFVRGCMDQETAHLGLRC